MTDLAQRIWQRYVEAPGVIPTRRLLAKFERRANFAEDRLPLLASLQRRWAVRNSTLVGGPLVIHRAPLPVGVEGTPITAGVSQNQLAGPSPKLAHAAPRQPISVNTVQIGRPAQSPDATQVSPTSVTASSAPQPAQTPGGGGLTTMESPDTLPPLARPVEGNPAVPTLPNESAPGPIIQRRIAGDASSRPSSERTHGLDLPLAALPEEGSPAVPTLPNESAPGLIIQRRIAGDASSRPSSERTLGLGLPLLSRPLEGSPTMTRPPHESAPGMIIQREVVEDLPDHPASEHIVARRMPATQTVLLQPAPSRASGMHMQADAPALPLVLARHLEPPYRQASSTSTVHPAVVNAPERAPTQLPLALSRAVNLVLQRQPVSTPAESKIGMPTIAPSPNEHASAAPVEQETVTPPVETAQRPTIDLAQLAEQVWRLIDRRLAVERERRGMDR